MLRLNLIALAAYAATFLPLTQLMGLTGPGAAACVSSALMLGGMVSLVALEAIINIGVTAGALPTKGLPLPFISYGGSGLIFHLIAIGLLLNVAKKTETCQ